MWYLVESGHDCDGGPASNKPIVFETLEEAEDYARKVNLSSDGIQYWVLSKEEYEEDKALQSY